MLRDAGRSFKLCVTAQNLFVSIGDVVPAVALLRPFSCPFLPYGPGGGIIQNLHQEPRERFGFADLERDRGAPRDLLVLRSRVVANDAPVPERLDERRMSPAHFGRLHVDRRGRAELSITLA